VTAVLVAIVGALATLGAAYLANRPQRKKIERMDRKVDGMDAKVDESHRMLTVNHHSSELVGKDPTILDHLDDLKTLLRSVDGRLTEHIKHADFRDLVVDHRLDRIEEHITKH
jgi:hypothetical protein